ncbi:MAG: hypothetical protein B1H40_00570 [Candidatus Latescibacteria bacterium 4484_181]|nr:MAG: hypothetical protein B1H40_00570 [Candidatus Latescibacteria bacterium 4484_181]RKY69509.1 MAG: hypothetical protein DRQ02_00695 [Candidatus Latescibacterota bacterium]RKY72528.1 MAG: hypothetical protein DRQ24_04805 [Candidatus Latescibacterota bacterium]
MENGAVAGTVDSLQISIPVGGPSRARFHRRLETPPTISFEGGMEDVFCEIAVLQQNLGKRWKNLQRGFSESGLNYTLFQKEGDWRCFSSGTGHFFS